MEVSSEYRVSLFIITSNGIIAEYENIPSKEEIDKPDRLYSHA